MVLHLSCEKLAQGQTRSFRPVDRDLVLGDKQRPKEGKSLNMIPVGVSEQNGGANGRCRAGEQTVAQQAGAGATVEHNRMIRGRGEFDAGGVAAEMRSGGSGRRDRASGAPETQPHVFVKYTSDGGGSSYNCFDVWAVLIRDEGARRSVFIQILGWHVVFFYLARSQLFFRIVFRFFYAAHNAGLESIPFLEQLADTLRIGLFDPPQPLSISGHNARTRFQCTAVEAGLSCRTPPNRFSARWRFCAFDLLGGAAVGRLHLRSPF